MSVALLVGVAVVASSLSALLPPEEVSSYANTSAVMLSNVLVYGEWIVTIVGSGAFPLPRCPHHTLYCQAQHLGAADDGGAMTE